MAGANAVAERIENAPANVEQHPASDTASLLQVISRAASDPNVDIDKMERLMAMHERLVARDAEQAFNRAMKEAQAEMQPIRADANNPQTRSKYASYKALDDALRPIYTKHGFSLSFDEADCPRPDYVRVVCYVAHEAGHTRPYHRDMPADGKGAKGGDVMTKTHAAGAAGSYGARYLLQGIFNVAVNRDDTDGNMPGAAITAEQRDDLLRLMDEHGADVARFCSFFKIEAVADLPASKLAQARKMVEAKRK